MSFTPGLGGQSSPYELLYEKIIGKTQPKEEPKPEPSPAPTPPPTPIIPRPTPIVQSPSPIVRPSSPKPSESGGISGFLKCVGMYVNVMGIIGVFLMAASVVASILLSRKLKQGITQESWKRFEKYAKMSLWLIPVFCTVVTLICVGLGSLLSKRNECDSRSGAIKLLFLIYIFLASIGGVSIAGMFLFIFKAK